MTGGVIYCRHFIQHKTSGGVEECVNHLCGQKRVYTYETQQGRSPGNADVITMHVNNDAVVQLQQRETVLLAQDDV
jgi:hypothetical protein